MEKRKWPWKRKSSESESSESFSSHSERFSDEQEGMKESANDNMQLPEETSKATITDDEMRETVKSLTEKLSAALVNVSAKEEIVKQHAKVAEEAVAGWEKAENEMASLKQQLEVALQQNLNLEVKTSHLDSALKECVRQLRQARDEQEKRISDALREKNSEWESTKAELEKRILDLQAGKSAPNTTILILEAMEKENSTLKEELVSCCKELEVVSVERDLSTQAAETASKLQLESIKKVAKLEAECRRLQSIARRLNSVERGPEPASGSHASALIVEPDQFKKASAKNLGVEIDMMDDFLEMERLAALPESSCRESVSVDNPLRADLDSMVQRVADLENVLEMLEKEKLELQNALYETVDTLEKAEHRIAEDETMLEELQKELNAVNEANESLEFQLISMEKESRTISANVDSLKAEAEARLEEVQKELNAVNEAKELLELQLISMEEESRMISANVDSLKVEAEARLEEVQKELSAVNEIKESLEFQLISMEEESRKSSENVDSLKAGVETERKLSAELRIKCQELENELSQIIQETELQQHMNSNGDLKIKQEDLAVAADKLTECQKTIASLGRQLESLATLEDFLIDTSSIPEFSRDSLDSTARGEFWRLSSNETFVPNGGDSSFSRISMENHGYVANGNRDSPQSLSLSPSSTNHGSSVMSRNSFGKYFC